jgi:hypothetical protein
LALGIRGVRKSIIVGFRLAIEHSENFSRRVLELAKGKHEVEIQAVGQHSESDGRALILDYVELTPLSGGVQP